MLTPRSLGIAIVCGILGAVPLSLALAKSPKSAKPAAKADAASKPEKSQAQTGAPAMVRVWKAELPGGEALKFSLTPGAAKEPALELPLEAKGATFTDYTTVPSGAVVAKVMGTAEGGAKVTDAPCNLAPGGFVTLIVRAKGDGLSIETVNDAPAGSDEKDAELTVRNFTSTLSEFTVRAGENLQARLRAADGLLYARGLERKPLLIETTSRDAKGGENKWETEVNFRAYRKATLLIFSDAYGRVRPRMAIDGALPIADASASPEGEQR